MIHINCRTNRLVCTRLAKQAIRTAVTDLFFVFLTLSAVSCTFYYCLVFILLLPEAFYEFIRLGHWAPPGLPHHLTCLYLPLPSGDCSISPFLIPYPSFPLCTYLNRAVFLLSTISSILCVFFSLVSPLTFSSLASLLSSIYVFLPCFLDHKVVMECKINMAVTFWAPIPLSPRLLSSASTDVWCVVWLSLIRTWMRERRMLGAVIKDRRVWVREQGGREVKLWLSATHWNNKSTCSFSHSQHNITIQDPHPTPPSTRHPHPHPFAKAIQSCLVISFVFISTSGRFRPLHHHPTHLEPPTTYARRHWSKELAWAWMSTHPCPPATSLNNLHTALHNSWSGNCS